MLGLHEAWFPVSWFKPVTRFSYLRFDLLSTTQKNNSRINDSSSKAKIGYYLTKKSIVVNFEEISFIYVSSSVGFKKGGC